MIVVSGLACLKKVREVTEKALGRWTIDAKEVVMQGLL
jgi:hypothetical protein